MSSTDLKLEAIVIPVSDVDRAASFYSGLGWRQDADFAFDNGFRVVQFTPPSSPTSVQFGSRITDAEPGSVQGIYLVVADVRAARDELAASGVAISEVFHPKTAGAQFRGGEAERASGLDDARASYGSFATFADPDGNTFLLQEVTTRLPGRTSTDATSYASVEDLRQALTRAAVAHGEHEARSGGLHDRLHDAQWPTWYAAYMVAEQAGTELPL
ncbi:VOC family protein [Nocardioides sp. CER19]|uniref:VOC family protein n=1 Tax=Nocardioides sp. CER19 TaxID=3038538 RepID=UPI0024473F62|nr:VOC family protein [Nocardioides sp. CER19]MDH2414394.1 VOC family protein [Nocardioides sp. CER19]